MKKFMGNNFLLKNETAKVLYHKYASQIPIIDYHCHVSPKEIAENKSYSNITELWLGGGDHYKWRAMRFCGIDEGLITGNASDYDKFRAYAAIMPKLIGNPLYHWSHLELKRYFGYDGILKEETCDEVWGLCNEKLAQPGMTVHNIIKNSNVELLCTTDDPADSLEWHIQIAQDDLFDVKVLPAFKPDKGIICDRKGYGAYIKKLSEASGIEIDNVDTLKDAYIKRLDFFAANGCCTADHSVDNYVPFKLYNNIDGIFKKALESDGGNISEDESDIFRTHMMIFFAGEYKKRSWVMQYHFGVLRNSNTAIFNKLGPDTGHDIISGQPSISQLAKLLNHLDKQNSLPKTILYSINPVDNAGIGALCGAFQPQLRHGSAWWFNDNYDGMREQMKQLANLSAFGNFLGMLTDSRSFISYTRHEYFRRILCDIIGDLVEDGLYPCDMEYLPQLVMDICYNNTKKFFEF